MTQVNQPKERHSYSKIDHDVTLMEMKEDCMKNGQLYERQFKNKKMNEELYLGMFQSPN
ncbi:hypothetical protein ACYCJJ_04795 [Staphylococcus borealis]|uniref:hypothetical protein n=1 Tax=Staphylococcus borealis TaxID=2742203 RepID=UPI0025A289DD|nr:hypothetical protein [Staphylococcus borealis]